MYAWTLAYVAWGIHQITSTHSTGRRNPCNHPTNNSRLQSHIRRQRRPDRPPPLALNLTRFRYRIQSRRQTGLSHLLRTCLLRNLQSYPHHFQARANPQMSRTTSVGQNNRPKSSSPLSTRALSHGYDRLRKKTLAFSNSTETRLNLLLSLNLADTMPIFGKRKTSHSMAPRSKVLWPLAWQAHRQLHRGANGILPR